MAADAYPMMGAPDVLADFQVALQLPGVEKSGNILADELRRRAQRHMANDRPGVVGAVKDWLEARDELLTVQAVVLARECGLVEVYDAIEVIRDEVKAGSFLRPSYLWIFDKALQSLHG